MIKSQRQADYIHQINEAIRVEHQLRGWANCICPNCGSYYVKYIDDDTKTFDYQCTKCFKYFTKDDFYTPRHAKKEEMYLVSNAACNKMAR